MGGVQLLGAATDLRGHQLTHARGNGSTFFSIPYHTGGIIQSISDDGVVLGPTDGVAILHEARLASGNDGNAYVLYDVYASGFHLRSYQQDLTQRWDFLIAGMYDPSDCDISRINDGNLLVGFTGRIPEVGNDDVALINKVSLDGTLLWGPLGIYASTPGSNGPISDIRVFDGGDLIYVAYYSGIYYYVAGFSYSGVRLWDQIIPEQFDDNYTEFCVTADSCLAATWAGMSYKIGRDGSMVWGVSGRPASSDIVEPIYSRMAANTIGGVAYTFSDVRAPTSEDLFAEQLNADGYRCPPEPSIMDVRDNAGDQGGWVILEIASSCYDRSGVTIQPIQAYNVWRRVDPIVQGNSTISGALPAGDYTGSVALGATTAGFPEGSWLSVGYYASADLEEYAFLVPTVLDSTSSNPAVFTYVVSAHTATDYFVSSPDSGYSVDNLPPEPVAGFVASYSDPDNALLLEWDQLGENDLQGYVLSRSTADYAAAEVIAVVQGTSHLDNGWFEGSGYQYFLEGVDIHGNHGPYVQIDSSEIFAQPVLEAPELSIYEIPDTRILTWQNSASAIYSETCVFRSETPDALDGEEITCTQSGAYLEDDLNRYYYVVRHRDVYGRLGEPSNEVLSQYPTGVSDAPAEFRLVGSFPNPFNPKTTIRFELPGERVVDLRVYDASGHLIRDLRQGNLYPAGRHEATWDGRDAVGRPTAAGVYFYRLSTGLEEAIGRMVLLK